MRKLKIFLHLSLDGMAEGKNGYMDIDWIAYDSNLERVATDVLSDVDTILWGRKTYEGMWNYWQTVHDNPEASTHEKNHAKWLDDVEKVVLSKTLNNIRWNNSKLISDHVEEEILNLKNKEGKDIVILGSPRLAQQVMNMGLVDELNLTISPVLLGEGLPLFSTISEKVILQLQHCESFESGAIHTIYKVLVN